MEKVRLGMIGIGSMGWPMAARLVQAGFAVTVFDAVPGQADKFAREVGGQAAATCAALDPSLPAGSASVGTRVAVEHRAPSPVGQELEVTASSSYADGRLHRFTVAARHVVGDRPGVVVASGEITRVVVDEGRFLARISPAS